MATEELTLETVGTFAGLDLPNMTLRDVIAWCRQRNIDPRDHIFRTRVGQIYLPPTVERVIENL